MNSSYIYSLQGCVSSLHASVGLLESSIASLNSGVIDLPRIKNVLKAERVFEVVPESEVNTVKTSLAGEVEPQLIELLRRAEGAIAKLERRQKNLIAKAELQEVRLQRQPRASPQVPESAVIDSDNARKWRTLQQKRERLEYSLSRLNLAAEQKQRQLRSIQ
ncbi:DASH complex subunit Spc19 [Lipomyces orientalis]|uniref:DASH complex subunit Spc19 n=1 Tax=Lipomyces orientalis TaxID=1233043 RepID=A0ACC3TIR6_9ASCO